MSDSENDATVLGKRPRHGKDVEENGMAMDTDKSREQMDADDDEDDDVGPMPMPFGADSHIVKKKRKGSSNVHSTLSIARTDRACSAPP